MRLEKISTIPIEYYFLTRCALSPDGRLLAAGHKDFALYEAETGKQLQRFSYGEFMAELKFSPSGRYIGCANYVDNHPFTRGKVALFDLSSGRLAYQAEAARPCETFALSHDDRYLAWKSFEQAEREEGVTYLKPYLEVYDLVEGKRLAPIVPPDLGARNLSFLPGGDRLACFGQEALGTDLTVEGTHLTYRHFRLLCLEFPGGKLINDLNIGTGAGLSRLSPDGKLLAVETVDFEKDERNVSVYDIETGLGAHLLELEADALPFFDFGGSQYLVCAKEDELVENNLLFVWEMEGLRRLGELKVDIEYRTASFCHEKGLLALAGGDRIDIYKIEI